MVSLTIFHLPLELLVNERVKAKQGGKKNKEIKRELSLFPLGMTLLTACSTRLAIYFVISVEIVDEPI